MRAILLVLATAAMVAGVSRAATGTVAEFDFTRAGGEKGWRPAHHIAAMQPAADGLTVTSAGEDPYVIGPAIAAPGDRPLWLHLRWRSDIGGGFQIFTGPGFTEETSVRGHMPAGRWTEHRIPLPPQKPGLAIRIDPPGASGTVTIATIRLEPRLEVRLPTWPEASPLETGVAATVTSGALAAEVGDAGFTARLDGESMAVCDDRFMVGYLTGGTARWFRVDSPDAEKSALRDGDGVTWTTRLRDPDGARWTFARRLAPGGSAGMIAIEAAVSVDADREIVCLPILLLRAGAGSFAERKTQGLFAGLEYLDDEPSSSTADIVGPESRRLAPLPHKVTMPLMTVVAGGRYVGLCWDPQPRLQPVFDSPDRTFGGGAHAMGLFLLDGRVPGRDEGSVICDPPLTLRAGERVVARARIIGGHGASVVAAVRHFVALSGLPALPASGYDRTQYAALAADGWLNSGIREDARFQHCVWHGRTPAPAADAPVHMRWLANAVADGAIAERLRAVAADAAREVPPAAYLAARVGHGRTFAPPLVFGHAIENAAAAAKMARMHLSHFAADGTVPYRRHEGEPDYGRTHPVPHANGMAALEARSALAFASFAGDRALLDEAIRRLRGLAQYRGGVPRGAQTWEIPLHTPDILASAHLVAAYTRGYELTGDRALLDEAVYWAWTGVPFIYLTPPTDGPIGLYNTVPVLGATNWRAPSWFGRPVQWCGLVYAEALRDLAKHEAGGPWKTLADGIAIGGIQHSWPASDRVRVGLLPDFFLLEEQQRDGPAINPLTVGRSAALLYGGPALDDFRCAGGPRWLVHAPGDLTVTREDAKSAELDHHAWPDGGGWVLVGGLAAGDVVTLDGRPVSRDPPNEADAARGLLAVRVAGHAKLRIERP